MHMLRIPSLSVLACFTALAALAACENKDEKATTEPAPDAASVAQPAMTAQPATTGEEGEQVGEKPPASGPVGGKRPGGPTDPQPDAGTDGGTEQACCCQAKDKPLEMVAMRECNKGRGGQCVKKEQCAADAKVDTGGEAGTVQTCCCEAGGKKEVVGMSECNKGRKGKCVKAAECKK